MFVVLKTYISDECYNLVDIYYHIYNVCHAEKRTKLSSILLLCLVRFSAWQTLVARRTHSKIIYREKMAKMSERLFFFCHLVRKMVQDVLSGINVPKCWVDLSFSCFE